MSFYGTLRTDNIRSSVLIIRNDCFNSIVKDTIWDMIIKPIKWYLWTNIHREDKCKSICTNKISKITPKQHITVTSQWAPWRLKSPTPRLFAQPLVQAHIKWNPSKLCVTGLCEGNPPVTGGFHLQRASNAEKICICWRHHEHHKHKLCCIIISRKCELFQKHPWDVEGREVTRSREVGETWGLPSRVGHSRVCLRWRGLLACHVPRVPATERSGLLRPRSGRRDCENQLPSINNVKHIM